MKNLKSGGDKTHKPFLSWQSAEASKLQRLLFPNKYFLSSFYHFTEPLCCCMLPLSANGATVSLSARNSRAAHWPMFGVKCVQTKQLKQPWQQMQLTLGRGTAKRAAGMTSTCLWWEIPIREILQLELLLRIHWRHLQLGCNALPTLLYSLTTMRTQLLLTWDIFKGAWKINSIELHKMKE